MKYNFDLGHKKTITFVKNGKKAYQINKDSGEYLVNADIKAADGTKFNAVIIIDTWSSGEHCGTYILLPNEIAEQGELGFLDKVGKTEKEFFPYKYKYRTELPCDDIHIGDDGWS